MISRAFHDFTIRDHGWLDTIGRDDEGILHQLGVVACLRGFAHQKLDPGRSLPGSPGEARNVHDRHTRRALPPQADLSQPLLDFHQVDHAHRAVVMAPNLVQTVGCEWSVAGSVTIVGEGHQGFLDTAQMETRSLRMRGRGRGPADHRSAPGPRDSRPVIEVSSTSPECTFKRVIGPPRES